MPSSTSITSTSPVLAGGPPVRVEGDGVEGDEPAHHLAHLAGGAEQADIGAAVGDDGEVGEVGAADGADDGHGLATRAPAADADGHARSELADDVVDGGALVAHSGGVGVALLDEGGPLLVGHAAHVQLVGEALLEAVAALHVDRVDAVERLLGPPDDGRALGGDLRGQLECGRMEAVRRHHGGHRP